MDDYLIYIKTIQGTIFKKWIETLKETLSEVCFVFDNNGIRLNMMELNTGNMIAIINSHLVPKDFQEFYIQKPMIIGLNIVFIHKFIKKISKDSSVILYVKKDDEHTFSIKLETEGQGNVFLYDCPTMQLEYKDMSINQANYSSVSVLSSADLQNILKHLRSFSDKVEIRSKDRQLYFTSYDEFDGKICGIIGEASDNYLVTSYTSNFKGTFSLKYLTLFTKATGLNPCVKLMLGNPLVLSYDVSNLGTLKFILSTCE